MLVTLILLVAGANAGAYAQAETGAIVGMVSEAETGEPLPGVNVVIADMEAQGFGAATDSGGRFVIAEVPAGEHVVEARFVGYRTAQRTVTVSAGEETTVQIELTQSLLDLDELVVVGYGSQRQRNLTGNVSRIEAQDIANTTELGVQETLQGQAAGVFVESQSGKLGQGFRVQVRGVSSVSADNQPLYVVDGIPVTTENLSSNGAPTNPLANLNFGDIESIEILKDASAASIYGSRGSNGVVLITTRSGQVGDTRVNFSYELSSSEPTNTVDFMNAEQYTNFIMEAAENADPFFPDFDMIRFAEERFDQLAAGTDWRKALNGEEPVVDTDWQDQAFQNATGMNAGLDVSGGTESTQFFLSGSFEDQSGIIFGDELRRITGRANVDHRAKPWLGVGARLTLTQTDHQRVPNDNQFTSPMQAVAKTPIEPPFVPRQEGVEAEEGLITEYVPTGKPNPETLYDNHLLLGDGRWEWDTETFRSVGKTYVDVSFFSGLSLRSEFGFDWLGQTESVFASPELDNVFGNQGGEKDEVLKRIINLTTNNYLTYEQAFAVHNIEVTTGFSHQRSERKEISVEGQRFPSTSFEQIDSAGEITGGGSFVTEYRFFSFFSRANYSYDDRYLLNVSGVVDGSSRFGENNQYGFFPAGSVGWILSEEEFLKNSMVSFLKLKGSVGVTGNAEIDNFASRGLWNATRFGNTSGLAPEQTPNPNLQWERTTQYNLGLEFGFFEDRISGSVDVYQKNTDDLLLDVNVPGNTGFQTQTQNVGEMKNRGLEFNLNTTNILTDDFSWSTSFNVGINENEVTNLDGQVIEGRWTNRAIEGEPLGVFFLREYAGVDPETGDALFYVNEKDEDGNIVDPEATTADFEEANRVVAGSPHPAFQGGLGNEFSFRNFDLNVFFQFVSGNDIFDAGGRWKSAPGWIFDNQTTDMLDAWEEPGDKTDIPEPRFFVRNGNQFSDRYLHDGSYIRLKRLTLGYNLPEALLSQVGIRNARLYVTGTNLLTFTDYKWWDPEVNADFTADDSTLNLGNEFYSAPQARRITGGLRIGF